MDQRMVPAGPLISAQILLKHEKLFSFVVRLSQRTLHGVPLQGVHL
jgi:hypothetical protein